MVGVDEYRITSDTVFVADITYKYDVKFIADGKTHNTQIVERNGKPAAPAVPIKANYDFIGWSVDGTNTVNVSNYTVTENVTFTAIFRIKSYTVTFKNGDRTVATQTIEHGKFATAPTATIDNFAGWSIDGETVIELGNYAITENVTFTAVCNKGFSASSPMHGKWLGQCVGENADEGTALISSTFTNGSPLEIRNVDSEQFYFLTTWNIPMGYPLSIEISELTYATLKFNWLMYSFVKFDLYYDSASDTIRGTFSYTSNEKTTVYNIVFERVEKSTFEGMKGTPFNYSDFS